MILISLFAHHKGMGSTDNGRDSNAKRLGPKRSDGQAVLAGIYQLLNTGLDNLSALGNLLADND